MALVVIEGFGGYGTGSHGNGAGDEMHGKFSNIGTVTLTSLQADAEGTRNYFGGQSGDNTTLPLPTDMDTIYLGFRLMYDGSTNHHLIQFRNQSDSSGSWTIGSLMLGRDGSVRYQRDDGHNFDTKLIVKTDSLLANQWHYIEIKLVFDGTTGSAELRVNGVTVDSATNVDTEETDGPCVAIAFAMNSLQSDWDSGTRIADLYIDDSQFRGPMRIVYQEANAAGGTAQWTPAASTNHSQVDEIGHDGVTTYNSSTSPGNFDRLTTTKSLNSDPLALESMAIARVEVEGNASIKVGVRSDPGGTPTESLGPEYGLMDIMVPIFGDIEETDPDTAAAWTAANADAAEIVYKHEN